MSNDTAASQRPTHPADRPTPGPWFHLENGDGFSVHGPDGSHVCYCEHATEWDDTGDPCEHPAEANAQLITAAPELLAALEQAVAALSPAPRDTDTSRIVELCERAIAKAKGGAQ
jgi:hypothetical protein